MFHTFLIRFLLNIVQVVLEVIAIGLGLASSIYFLLNLVLGIEVVAALLSSCQPQIDEQDLSRVVTYSVLVPAHNEASGIEATLRGLLREVSSPQQICVIADNCTDDTASISRLYGVKVLERTNAKLIGKRYALDFGLMSLAESYPIEAPPEVVVMVDADCQVSPGTIQAIAQRAATSNRPVQAVYRMASPPNPSPKDGVSAFAFTVRNRVRAGGLSSLKLPILLGGTGMAFPWQALQQVNIASGYIAEDMKLGIDLTIAGYAPTLATDYLVTGQIPSSEEAATSQRTRWEPGQLESSLTTYVPQLLAAAIRQRRMGLVVLALDLAIPPLSLWVEIGVVLTIAAATLVYEGGALWPLVLQLCASGLLFGSIGLAAIKWLPAELSLLKLLELESVNILQLIFEALQFLWKW